MSIGFETLAGLAEAYMNDVLKMGQSQAPLFATAAARFAARRTF
jgi:hypothetical protein